MRPCVRPVASHPSLAPSSKTRLRRLQLLEVHCAVWPHKIMASVYAPVTRGGHVTCPASQQQQPRGDSLQAALAWLGFGSAHAADAACPHAGMPVEQLKKVVRATQQRAQQTGEPTACTADGPTQRRDAVCLPARHRR